MTFVWFLPYEILDAIQFQEDFFCIVVKKRKTFVFWGDQE